LLTNKAKPISLHRAAADLRKKINLWCRTRRGEPWGPSSSTYCTLWTRPAWPWHPACGGAAAVASLSSASPGRRRGSCARRDGPRRRWPSELRAVAPSMPATTSRSSGRPALPSTRTWQRGVGEQQPVRSEEQQQVGLPVRAAPHVEEQPRLLVFLPEALVFPAGHQDQA
jgi:hypothetical protein